MNTERLFYHTRLIPKEYLKLETPLAQTLIMNKLCDTATDEVLEVMKDYGIDVIETRLVWWDMEKEKGVYNFSRVEEEIKKINAAGIKVGIFAWLQHPPKWFLEEGNYTHLTCIEHGEQSNMISLWDEQILEVYERLYKAIADRIGDKIDFWYVGVYGDYGELFFPNDVEHYHFLSEHNHAGLWCGDEKAKASYSNYLKDKYKTESELNKAWKTSGVTFDETMYFSEDDSITKKLDFRDWYCGSMTDFTDKVCALARKYFPNMKMGLPIGHAFEPLEIGQIKSHASKISAKHGIVARWTAWAACGDFEITNICTRRVCSAAKFYGADFGVEAAHYLSGEIASHAIFEALSNSAGLLHNDPGNIIRGMEVYKLFKNLDKPPIYECDCSVFYPIEAEQCGLIDDMEEVYKQFSILRRSFDYEITDSYMIKDGFLEKINTLIFASGTPLTKETAEIIKQRVNDGKLKLLCFSDDMPYVMDSDAKETILCEVISKEIAENTKRVYRTKFPGYTLVFDADKDEISTVED